MNLTTDQDQYTLSITTDDVPLLGIVIFGLPASWDDKGTKDLIHEADLRYNNTSELLEAINAENELHESSPACAPDQYESALKFIKLFIKCKSINTQRFFLNHP